MKFEYSKFTHVDSECDFDKILESQCGNAMIGCNFIGIMKHTTLVKIHSCSLKLHLNKRKPIIKHC